MGLIADTKQAIRDSPKGIFNWYVVMCTCIFAFSGVSKGFDEGKTFLMNSIFFCLATIQHLSLVMKKGNIASIVVQTHFRKVFGLAKETDEQYANTKGWLVAIANAGAVFGCLGVC